MNKMVESGENSAKEYFINHFFANEEKTLLALKVAKAELDEAKKELDEKQAEAQEQLQLAASYKSQIESKTAEYESLYNSLSEEYQTILAREEEERAAAAAAASAAYFPSVSVQSDDGDGGSSSGGGSSYSGGGSNLGGSDAVSRAQSALGLPYVYGSGGPDSFDCSGLVSYALTGSFGHAYVSQDFWALPAVSDPQPGDVVACSAGHCGLYIGGGQMIEAPHTGAVVRVSSVRGKIVRP